MNNRIKAACVIVAFITAATTVHANTTDGSGMMPCSKILAESEKSLAETEDWVIEWGLGFMTGINLAQKPARNFGKDISQRIWIAVGSYCKQNPDKEPIYAVFGLWKDLPTE